jgi:hypothetical protein
MVGETSSQYHKSALLFRLLYNIPYFPTTFLSYKPQVATYLLLNAHLMVGETSSQYRDLAL